jgi:hypothetical protein
VVVADIVGKESLEVALVAGDDMVEQIAAATTLCLAKTSKCLSRRDLYFVL